MPDDRHARTRKNYEGDNVDFPTPQAIDWSKRDPFMQPVDE